MSGSIFVVLSEHWGGWGRGDSEMTVMTRDAVEYSMEPATKQNFMTYGQTWCS